MYTRVMDDPKLDYASRQKYFFSSSNDKEKTFKNLYFIKSIQYRK